ncbi:MAG: hypothetical protein V3V67_02925 [Myxococcota bacterium]
MAGVERRLVAILSADVAGYSRLMAEDEESTVRTLEEWRFWGKDSPSVTSGQASRGPSQTSSLA